VLGDFLLDERIAEIRLGEEAAELALGVAGKDGDQELALVGRENRPVVGDEFRKQAEQEQEQEDPQRIDAAAIRFEQLPAPPVDARQPRPGGGPQEPRRRAGGRNLGRGDFDALHRFRASKSILGSIQV
jgi:hypothetical protein